jgi:glycosyltransferase involved in cell wall biosynthesis
MTGNVSEARSYYSIMDVFALPSYREGFPTVLLEAAAAQIPIVAFKSTGCVDAISDGITGTLVPLGDTNSLARALQRYLCDNFLKREHGRLGRERILRLFRSETIWELLYGEYKRLLKTRSQILFQRLVDSQDDAAAQN